MSISRGAVIFLLFILVPAESSATAWVHTLNRIIIERSKKAAPHADQTPAPKASTDSIEEVFGLSKTLITKSLGKGYHNKTCPTMGLRISLPQLNTQINVPSNLNIRRGPGTNFQKITKVGKAGIWTVDLLRTNACWMQVRWGQNNSGWIYSKLLKFTFHII